MGSRVISTLIRTEKGGQIQEKNLITKTKKKKDQDKSEGTKVRAKSERVCVHGDYITRGPCQKQKSIIIYKWQQ